MSNRTMLEINHDLAPGIGAQAWLAPMMAFYRSGDPADLPTGVTWFGTRHHSEPCPLGDPPRGWDNERPTVRTTDPDAAEPVVIPISMPAPMPIDQQSGRYIGLQNAEPAGQTFAVQDARAPGVMAAHPRRREE